MVLLAATTLLTGCGAQRPSALQQIRARGELRVVTLNLPTCYYLGAQGPEGLEYDLASRFAAELGVRLKIFAVPSDAAIREELAKGEADIAAAQITATPAWSKVGEVAAPYAEIPQLVVYRQGEPAPRDTLQLETAKLAVRADSPQERLLARLKAMFAPHLTWVETAPSTADPLEDVDSGQARYAIVDARTYSYAHHLYPDIRVGFTLPRKRPVQWVVRRGGTGLVQAVNRFFHEMKVSGQLAHLMRKNSGAATSLHYQALRLFQVSLTQRLPLYRAWFQEAAAKYGLDWRLLAAIGFQESHWDPTATSPNGAVGVMMLTADTAQAMGIKNRENPKESIFAGARYLAEVRHMVPKHIPEPDRTWFTVASYNVGFGHVEDARIIAQELGKDPDSWAAVSQELPKLAEPRWFLRAKCGYAQGWQPVEYVERVRQFMQLLEWQPDENLPNVTIADAEPSWSVAGNGG
ncbi:MAG TPA: membrane-bound lytic murein transglycosylase MltF [Steroidobacteraceae bacterium]|nr:membrane-bound lytic murein transglycosylase MltF [Steroidobacteraceae bacterium]